MKAEHHVVASAAFSGVLYLVSSSWQTASAAFVAGVFIDVDHFIDYIIEFGMVSDWRNFFSCFDEGQFDKIYVLFHGWEWMLVFGAAAWLTGYNPWVTGVFLGATQHLVLDQFTNGTSAFGYSILWRLSMRFEPDPAFPRRKVPFHGPGRDGIK